MQALFLLLTPALVISDLASVKLGLNEVVLTQGFKFLENALKLVPLGNHSFTTDGITLNLTNILLNNTLAVKEESFLILEPCTIQINFTDLNVAVTFNYSENGKLPGKGNATFPDSFILLQFVVSVLDGGLQIDLTEESNIVIGTAVVNTGLGKIINAELAKELNQVVFLGENTIMALIEPYLADNVNPVLYSLAKLIPIPPLHMMYNISLTDESLIEGTYLTLPVRGEFLIYPFRTKFFPFMTTPLPSISNSRLPLQFLLSDYNLAAPLTALWTNLHLNVTQLPKILPLQLTTDGLAFLFPGLKKQFGSGKPVMIGITPCNQWGVPLNISIPNGFLVLDLGMQLDFYVNTSGINVTFAMTLYWQLALNLTFSETNFTGNLNIQSLQLLNNILAPGNVAPVNMPVLNKTLGLLVKTIVPLVNALGTDFVIPAPNIPFVSINATTITLLNRCILLEAGFELDLEKGWNNGFKFS